MSLDKSLQEQAQSIREDAKKRAAEGHRDPKPKNKPAPTILRKLVKQSGYSELIICTLEVAVVIYILILVLIQLLTG